ncbi:MAG: rubrerythrin [Oscillospiraceae bacterium]|nr:rubrerythrin [Oscillospiraceae bacterium]
MPVESPKILTEVQLKTLIASQQGELDAVLMYNALAKTVKDPGDAETFRRLAAEEGGHAAVFKALTQQVLKPKKTKAILLPLIYRLLGKKRVYPIIAQGEYDAVKKYEPVAAQFPEVESVKNDEQRHGDTVLSLLE